MLHGRQDDMENKTTAENTKQAKKKIQNNFTDWKKAKKISEIRNNDEQNWIWFSLAKKPINIMIERPKTNPKKDKRILAIEDLFIRLCCFDSPYFTLLLDVHFYPYLTNDGKRTKKKSR